MALLEARATASFSVESSMLFPATEYSREAHYMTTVFTPKPECTSRPLTGGSDYVYSSGVIMWDSDVYPGISLECSDPNRVTITDSTAYAYAGGAGDDAKFVGGVCPEGYTTVGTRLPTDPDTYYSYNTAEMTSYSTMVPRTHAFCCPPGFSLGTNYDENAGSGIREKMCHSLVGSGTVTVTSRDYANKSSSIFTTTKYDFTAYDRGYFVSWNALQLPYFTPESAPILNIADKSITSLPQTITSTPTGPGATGGSRGGSGGGGGGTTVVVVLSRGAIAGIVIGALVGVGVIGACFVACFQAIFKKGGKKKKNAQEENATGPPA